MYSAHYAIETKGAEHGWNLSVKGCPLVIFMFCSFYQLIRIHLTLHHYNTHLLVNKTWIIVDHLQQKGCVCSLYKCGIYENDKG